ncbi:MAG: DsbA family protein [Nitrosopumilus sp.]|nr:DsbA family protein [Nitrosopumilus sp.]NND87551.1 DsbA family protein [Nitrosopumilus sp.]NNL53366.1 DsbA family protein [Nitrosopumilus sp.]NNM03314.1 DsbA family protein [Nitrosopumilus sp.]
MIKKSTFTSLVVVLVILIAIASFFAGSYVTNLDSDKLTKSYLNDAISKLELKMENNVKSPNQPNTKPVKISIDDDPMKGNPDAKITIIEFSDYECPFCGRFYTNTLPLIEENYINTGLVNFVYRDFPIQSIHDNALPAALATECADDQGKFWPYHNMIFENKSTWEKLNGTNLLKEFEQYAIVLGLSTEEFNSCLESGKHLEEVKKDLQDGRDYGVTGTPGFFVGNDELGYVELKGAQPFESFQKVIDRMLMQ